MENVEKTIDLTLIFNNVKNNIKKIILITILIGIVSSCAIAGFRLVFPSEELYYSSAKILFKYSSWSTSEKDYSLENWSFNGSEFSEHDSNKDFIYNSDYIFTTDKIIMNLMDKYDVDSSISKFKKNIFVKNIPDTDFVRIVVTASSPEIASEMLDTIISEGINSVKNLYELKYEIIDQYTYSKKPFSKLTIDEDGQIKTSSDLKSNIKLVTLCSFAGFSLSVVYFVLKCILNDKVESVDYIEQLHIPVLQVLGIGSKDYDLAATKLINSNKKSVLFTSFSNEDRIAEDIIGISKNLLTKNVKSLIVCVESDGCANELGCVVDNNITIVNEVNLIGGSIKEVRDIISNYENQYDLIFVETKSVSEKSDALFLSKFVDSTVFISKCNSVDSDILIRTANDFNNYGKGVSGLILKNVTKESSSYKYVK